MSPDTRVTIDGTDSASRLTAGRLLPPTDFEQKFRSPHRLSWQLRSRPQSWRKMMLYSAGIVVSYAIFGILQEAMLKTKYGPLNEQFDFFYSLLLVQCLVSAIVAKVLIRWFNLGPDHTASAYYVSGAGLHIGGMLASVSALRYVDYPTQIVVKSAKPLPVMALGVALADKRYPARKWFYVTLIVSGVALFILEGDHQQEADTGNPKQSRWYGNALLAVSIAADSLVSVLQDVALPKALGRGSVAETKALHIMYATNAISVLYMVIVMAVGNPTEFMEFLTFVQRFPQLHGELTLFCASSTIGQIFIFSTIADFGSLVCAVVTTMRKFFTVLGSVLLFGHKLHYVQWIASVFVFGGLLLDAATLPVS